MKIPVLSSVSNIIACDFSSGGGGGRNSFFFPRAQRDNVTFHANVYSCTWEIYHSAPGDHDLVFCTACPSPILALPSIFFLLLPTTTSDFSLQQPLTSPFQSMILFRLPSPDPLEHGKLTSFIQIAGTDIGTLVSAPFSAT